MKLMLWWVKWALKAAIFFTLFAFALNNQQDTSVHFFFGRQWQAPLVLVVLCAFAAGVFVGVLGMVPRWWKHRRAALQGRSAPAANEAMDRPSGDMPARTLTPPDVPHGV
jgi:uncharacterized integral membrane protein